MNSKYAAFSALDPFFAVVQRGLSGLVDGEHYFDRPLHEDLIVATRESHALGKLSHGLQSSPVYSRSTR